MICASRRKQNKLKKDKRKKNTLRSQKTKQSVEIKGITIDLPTHDTRQEAEENR